VISELTIADMDGCSLREKSLLDPGTREVPFIFLIPEGQSEKEVRALRSGVDDCIEKPFDPVVVVARVQAVLARRRTYEMLVRVDPLTRVLNRPTVEREITAELARVLRYDRFASLALLDMDDFATVNADHGQALGDLLLTCLGGIILTNMRAVDIAGRYRGEQFLLYLPETHKANACVLLERILTRFAAVADAMAGLKVTFSAVIAEPPADGKDLEVLTGHCRDALRKVKEQGKGRIALWETE
jgi:diguanylate cyclase (GGDEF)-like protein